MKISIITVSYNSASTIKDTFDSIRIQNYNNIEYIVVDGGSTDETISIIKNNNDIISNWISEKDNGIFDAFNKGIALASGDIVGILNSDDFYTNKNVISDVIKAFLDYKVDSVYGNLLYTDPVNTNIIKRKWIDKSPYDRNRFKNGWMPPHPTFFVKKTKYKLHGHFNTTLTGGGDYELMLRFLFKYRISSYHIPKILVKMRTGGNSNSSIKNRLRGIKDDVNAWKVNNLKHNYFISIMKIVRKLNQFF
ncbi:glycosyltransferase [Schleiferiaceae bacterium]|nr:glycosyltransferase [Schleiferiaceae bacterium]